MKYLLTILLAITTISAFSQNERVEILVTADSCYTAPVDGVFIDLDSYVGISYELEKVDSLKQALPELKKSLEDIEIAKDSMAVAHLKENKNLSLALDLETQSKNQLKNRVANLQHNYNVTFAKADKFRKQRNRMGGIAGGLLALIAGIIIF